MSIVPRLNDPTVIHKIIFLVLSNYKNHLLKFNMLFKKHLASVKAPGGIWFTLKCKKEENRLPNCLYIPAQSMHQYSHNQTS